MESSETVQILKCFVPINTALWHRHRNEWIVQWNRIEFRENSLAIQQLRFCTLIAESMGSIPDQGTKIPQAMKHGQKKKKKKQNLEID